MWNYSPRRNSWVPGDSTASSSAICFICRENPAALLKVLGAPGGGFRLPGTQFWERSNPGAAGAQEAGVQGTRLLPPKPGDAGDGGQVATLVEIGRGSRRRRLNILRFRPPRARSAISACCPCRFRRKRSPCARSIWAEPPGITDCHAFSIHIFQRRPFWACKPSRSMTRWLRRTATRSLCSSRVGRQMGASLPKEARCIALGERSRGTGLL